MSIDAAITEEYVFINISSGAGVTIANYGFFRVSNYRHGCMDMWTCRKQRSDGCASKQLK